MTPTATVNRKGTLDVVGSAQPNLPGDGDVRWVEVCASVALPPGEAVVAPTQPPIAVFNVDGEFFATDDTCTHAQSSLAEGFIDGDTVECEMHFATFCIRTGAALTPPAVIPLKTYPVTVVDGSVFVAVS
jgi:nitrite reductase/ring-hydroxylating ferredoxin subunit